MIHEEKIYIVACDLCERTDEDLKDINPLAWRTRKEAMQDWTDLDCGPAPAPDGKALCWECADKTQAGESNE